MSSTRQRLCDILAHHYGLAPERMTPDATLIALGIDSLGTVELLWTVEEAFKLDMPAKAPALRTVGDLVKFVDGLLARQVQPALGAAH